MLKRILLLLSLFVLALPAFAQDDTPELAIERAQAAAESVIGSRAPNFNFQIQNPSTNSSLGCPLVTGSELPFAVTPVQVNLVYGDGVYIVLSSMSGQLVVLCDAKFGEAVSSQTVSFACQATPVASIPAYVAPNTNMEGVFTAAAGTAYTVYGVSSDRTWLQIGQTGSGAGWVEATSVTTNPECASAAVPTMAVTDPTVTQNVCFITPLSRFSNLRSTPSTDGARVARLYENQQYQASARNTAGDWFFIQPAGWVSNTVVRTVGSCVNITVNDGLVGTGFAQETGGAVDTNASVILQQLACPTDFAGYLPPRISIGSETAKVSAGATPNALRDYPATDDTIAPRVGVIQPNRTLNRVIAGPVCNQLIVWWLVELDGTVGWTAESNNNTGEYYLESTLETASSPAEAPNSLSIGTNSVDTVLYNEDGSNVFTLSTEQGFGDATMGVVQIWDSATGQALARIEEPAGIVAIDYAFQRGLLMVAAANGTVTLYDTQTFEAFTSIPEVFTVAENAHLLLSPDGSFIIVTSCFEETCGSSQVRALLVTGATEIGTVLLQNSPTLALALSPDGSRLVILSADGVEVFGLPSLNTISTWQNTDNFPVYDIVLNPVGNQALVSGCNNADCTEGRVALLDTVNASVLGVVSSHSSAAILIAYKPDATRFATTSAETAEIIERSATTGQETQRFTLESGTVTSMAYSFDGRSLAVGTSEGTLLFLDLSQQ